MQQAQQDSAQRNDQAEQTAIMVSNAWRCRRKHIDSGMPAKPDHYDMGEVRYTETVDGFNQRCKKAVMKRWVKMLRRTEGISVKAGFFGRIMQMFFKMEIQT
jgi:hypothetical protein